MNARLANKFDMMKVVVSVCEKESTAMGSIPKLAAAFTDFKSTVTEIDDVINEQIAVLTGFTKSKNLAKVNMAQLACKVSMGVMSYAYDTLDAVLEDAVDFKLFELMRMRRQTMINECENILKSGTDNEAALGDYGVDSAILAALADAVTDFKKKCNDPVEFREKRKTSTARLSGLMDKATQVLCRKVDRLIYLLPDIYADFRKLYANARIIINLPGKLRGSTPLAGTGMIDGRICSAFDESPVESALVYLVELDLMVESDEDGDYYFEEVPAGTYTLKVFADSYAEATKESVEILDAAEVTVDFDLEAAV
jgi:hypothetical protein